MAKTKRIVLTDKLVNDLLKSPALVKKRKKAEKLFNSPQFRAHIEKRAAQRRSAQSRPKAED
jgi:hypothetical protein